MDLFNKGVWIGSTHTASSQNFCSLSVSGIQVIKKINNQRNQLTNRHIFVLSVFLTLFGVAVGMGLLVDSGKAYYVAPVLLDPGA